MSAQILIPANYREQGRVEFHAPVIPNQDWFAQGPVEPSEKKPPRTAAFDVSCVGAKTPRRREKTRDLDDTYVFENRAAVSHFVEEHRLQNLLVQAKEHLKERFGTASVKTLAVVCDDEGFESLFCTVIAPGTLQENMNALRAFDRDWWLGQVASTGGRLNFDFQLL